MEESRMVHRANRHSHNTTILLSEDPGVFPESRILNKNGELIRSPFFFALIAPQGPMGGLGQA